MWRTAFISLLFAVAGCGQNPDEQPKTSDLVGTWIPVSSSSVSSTQFLRLNADHTFFATNFPVSPRFGQTSTDSGSGAWTLEPKYAAWVINLTLREVGSYQFNVYHRKSPFLLTAPIMDDDLGIQAHRLEDLAR
jgi:hypothetical protein